MTYDPTLDPQYWRNMAAALKGSNTAQSKATAAEYLRVAGLLSAAPVPPVITPTTPTSPPVGLPPSAPFRLFADTSPWNSTKAFTTFHTLADPVLRARNYGLNNSDYCHPLYVAKTTDPLVTIDCGEGWGNPPRVFTVNAPADMHRPTGTDGPIDILLTDGRLLDCFNLKGSGTAWTAQFYGISLGLTGTGWGVQPWTGIGTTAVGCPQAAGTILASDVAAGVIPHALCVAFSYDDQGYRVNGNAHVPPAVGNDVGGGGGPLAEGMLLIIPASTPMPTGLKPMEQAAWKAATTYGVYVTDRLDGQPMFYGDGTAAVGAAFSDAGLTTIGRALRAVKTW